MHAGFLSTDTLSVRAMSFMCCVASRVHEFQDLVCVCGFSSTIPIYQYQKRKEVVKPISCLFRLAASTCSSTCTEKLKIFYHRKTGLRLKWVIAFPFKLAMLAVLLLSLRVSGLISFREESIGVPRPPPCCRSLLWSVQPWSSLAYLGQFVHLSPGFAEGLVGHPGTERTPCLQRSNGLQPPFAADVIVPDRASSLEEINCRIWSRSRDKNNWISSKTGEIRSLWIEILSPPKPLLLLFC